MLSSAAAADWPTASHNPERNAATDDPVEVERLQRAWEYDTGTPQPAWYGPAKWDAYATLADLHSMRNYDVAPHVVASDGRCYFGSTIDNSVTCLDTNYGSVLWRYYTQGPVRIAPTLHEGLVLFGSDDGYAYCLNAEDGTLVWRFTPTESASQEQQRLFVNNGNFIPAWPIRTGVVVDGLTAYFGASLLPWRQSYLCAVDMRTGKPNGDGRFVRQLDQATLEGPLALSSELIVAPQGRVAPMLFARRDGKPLGMLEGGGGAFAVVAGEQVLHGPGNKAGWLTRSNAKTRERLATHQQARAVVVRDGVSYLLTKRNVVALQQAENKPLWQSSLAGGLSMIATPDAVIVGSVDKVTALDIETGEARWEKTIDGRAHGLAVSDGSLFVSTDIGTILYFQPRQAPGKPAPTSFSESPAKETMSPLTPPAEVEDDALIGRWIFQLPLVDGGNVRDLVSGEYIEANAMLPIQRLGEIEALVVEGQGPSIVVAEDFHNAQVPEREFTVETWVRVDKPTAWGSFVGVIHDNGPTEFGWLLGYRDDHFCLGLAAKDGKRGLTYMSADKPFTPGRWYYVAGIYDGQQMRLYVDGRLSATSNEQSGDISYPEKTFYEIAAYHDSNEYYPLHGALHEVRVSTRALDAQEVKDNYLSRVDTFPPPIEPSNDDDKDPKLDGYRVAVGPWLRFIGPGRARVEWLTNEPTPGVVELFDDGEMRRYDSPEVATRHAVELSGLRHDRVYRYRIRNSQSVEITDKYECDTFFDFTRGYASDYGPIARKAIDEHADEGLCLVFADDPEAVVRDLAGLPQLITTVVCRDDQQATSCHELVEQLGVAHRVKVLSQPSLGEGWLTPRIANLIVARGEQAPAQKEIERLLAPTGAALIDDFGSWQVTRGRPLEGAGEWTHQYGGAGNSAFGGETLSGVDATSDLAVQWISRPGPRYQSDRQSRKPSPLAAGGKLLLQGLDRIIAVDQYNGTVLWAIEAPFIRRYNIPRDSANWCADESHVYLAVRDYLWKIHLDNGDVEPLPVPTDGLAAGKYDWGYIGSLGDTLLGSVVTEGTAVGDFWGGAFWFDATSGTDTHQAVSQRLFAIDKSSADSVKWHYQNGMILNSTISANDDQVTFVECRHPSVTQGSGGRVASADIWKEQHLVALDAKTGQVVWEKALDIVPATVMINTAVSGDHLAIVGSSPKQFDIYVFDLTSGDLNWHATTPWPGGRSDHGVHLARPAIVGNSLFVRPVIYDLATGKLQPDKFPVGGCGTYACTSSALLFRSGSGGLLSMWTPGSSGYTHWARVRPDCWLSSIPAGGMLLSPEGGGGCSCGNWMETSIGFLPKVHLAD